MQLARNNAGMRFLGLATSMVATMGSFQSAAALELMLAQSAAVKQLLPSKRRLQDLMEILEGRSHASGFADSVIGWGLLLRDPAVATDFQREWLSMERGVPCPESLEKVVDAFRQPPRIDEDLIDLGVSPFGSHSKLMSVISLVLDKDNEDEDVPSSTKKVPNRKTLPKFEDDMEWIELPKVGLLYDDLEKRCGCEECRNRPSEEGCLEDSFARRVATLTALVLALSLFEQVKDLKFRVPWCPRLTGMKSFLTYLTDLLDNEDDSAVSLSLLLDLAMQLIGHDVSRDVEHDKWAMASFKGQVVFPVLFETHIIQKHGFLNLWHPGALQYKGETYNRVVGR